MELPNRKTIRAKNFDYNTVGVYFLTICTQNRRCLLSRIVGRGLAPAVPELTAYGKVAEEELLNIEKRYPYVKIDKYVIMPNHIHIILVMGNETAGASPRPTMIDVICAYKSLTTRKCKSVKQVDKLFQASFYDHIIRDRADYEAIAKYIHENPLVWYYDDLYSDS